MLRFVLVLSRAPRPTDESVKTEPERAAGQTPRGARPGGGGAARSEAEEASRVDRTAGFGQDHHEVGHGASREMDKK